MTTIAPRAIGRLAELMESDDERVAAVACNSLLDRGLGRVRVQDEDINLDPESTQKREEARKQVIEMLEQHAQVIRENAELKRRLSAE